MKYYDLGDRVVTSCPKAGSKAIRNALGGCEIQVHQAVNKGRIITFLRHPIERLKSAYRWFQHKEGWQQDMMHYGKNATWQGFVDSVVSDGNRNRHWLPQSELLRHGRTFVPTEVYRFEMIGEIWPLVVGKPLEVQNKSDHSIVVPDYRTEELDNLYAEDLERWENAHLTAQEQ